MKKLIDALSDFINFSLMIFGKRVISPWYIKLWGIPGGSYSNDLEYPFLLKLGDLMIKIPKVRKMGGSHNTTTYSVGFYKYQFDQEHRTYNQISAKEMSFTWRLDVSWDYFDKESFRNFKRREFEKMYPKNKSV